MSTTAKRPLKVFLCHAHADRDAVHALYARLTKDGVDAWLDKEKLLPGQDWELEIKKAVREADVVAVCLSKQFNQAGFRQKEVKWALDTAMEKTEREIFIIPARLEECETLESLRKWHWVDLFEDDGFEKLMLALDIRAQTVNASLNFEKKSANEIVQNSNLQLAIAYDATIQGWVQSLEWREGKNGHTSRLVDLTLRLARAMGVSEEKLEDIRIGALLHDLGYMGIPEAILNKPGVFNEDEWKIMRSHPQYAYDMLMPITYLRAAVDIPYCHHENWDGTGYPRGLKDVAIPVAARIFSVVDVYDSLTNNKPYRKSWDEEKTVKYIQEQSGKKFDPDVVAAFLKLIPL